MWLWATGAPVHCTEVELDDFKPPFQLKQFYDFKATLVILITTFTTSNFFFFCSETQQSNLHIVFPGTIHNSIPKVLILDSLHPSLAYIYIAYWRSNILFYLLQWLLQTVVPFPKQWVPLNSYHNTYHQSDNHYGLKTDPIRDTGY